MSPSLALVEQLQYGGTWEYHQVGGHPQPVTPDPRATPAGEAESVVILQIKSVCRIYHT